MGFFDGFLGKSQGRDLDSAHANATRDLASGYGEATGISNDYYGRARGDIEPWMQSGRGANALYGRAIGLEGRAGQQQFMNDYAGDPFRQFNQDFATNQVRRQYNSRGMDTSGNALMASARASQERGSQDYERNLGHLERASGQGGQFAQYGAGLASQQGNALMNMRYGYGQQKAADNIAYGNAKAANRNTPWQNMIGIAGVAAKAASGRPG